MKQLKDYLHYYLYGKIYEVGVSTCQLIGIGDCYYTVKTKQGALLTLSDRADIKLVLRRLEDMTEEEAEKLAMIYSGADSVKRTKGVASNWHYYDCIFSGSQTERLTITADGSAWYAHYFDKTAPGFRNIINEHNAFHYLLQQGFDLFGLIDAGLAIDTKTITP